MRIEHDYRPRQLFAAKIPRYPKLQKRIFKVLARPLRLAEFRNHVLGRNYAAAVICLGTNDAQYVRTVATATVLESNVLELLSSVKSTRIVALGPLGLRNRDGREHVARAVSAAISRINPPSVSLFVDASAIAEEYYREDRVHLTPSGHKALSIVLWGRAKEVARRQRRRHRDGSSRCPE